ncbi:hypothetical protein [Frondihabitans australicus]|uniref:hypothetical protein n=1 Tax=Frondihabitans australicus TaxID=386892 RepID=UPI000EB066F7|nr:hypothetical protein [Frondihabitans australicus]
MAHVTGCPSKAANEPSGQSVTSHREDLVSLTPTGAVVCSYSATTPDWVAKSLAAGEAKRLGTLLNQAGSNITPGSASSCPADFGGTVVVYLWSARQTSTVWIHTGGCRVATNGITSREGAYAGSLAAYLHRTVKSPAA